MNNITLTISLSVTTELSAYQLSVALTKAMTSAIETSMAETATLQRFTIEDITTAAPKKESPCGTFFPHGESAIQVKLDENNLIVDAWMTDVDCTCRPVAQIPQLARYVQDYRAGRRAPVFTDHDEEPSEIVYLATSPRWQEAKLITNIDTLAETLADPSVSSFVQLSMETGYF